MNLRAQGFAGLRRRRSRGAGFTLAEVLAALVFLAIVIPVVAHGLSVASRAGTSANRRYLAGLVAERVLNESVVTTNWTASRLSGIIRQGNIDFRWTLRSEPWNHDPNVSSLRLLSAEVSYPVQGAEHRLVMSTLVDEAAPTEATNVTDMAY